MAEPTSSPPDLRSPSHAPAARPLRGGAGAPGSAPAAPRSAPAGLAASLLVAAAVAPLGGQQPGPPARDSAARDPGRPLPADTLEEEPPRRPAADAGTLEVTVTRSEAALREVPYAASVVDAASTQAVERRTSLHESTILVPGVQVFDRRNHSLGDRLVVRGVGSRAQFGVRGIKVIADGIPLTLPDGQATLTNLDLGSARRIEIIRGSASALYGNAAGGVIRVESGGFAEGPLAVRPRVLFGAGGLRTQELGTSGRVGQVDWLLRGSHLETDGFRSHAAAETWRANLVARRGLEDGGELRAVLNVFDTPFSENPSSLSREDARENPTKARDFIVAQGAGESATQGQAGVTLDRPVGGDGRLRATVWGLARDLRNPIPGRIVELDRLAGGARLEAGGTAPAGLPARWTAGLDAEVQSDDRRESVNLGVERPGGDARAGATLLDQQEQVAYAAPFLRLSAEPARGLRVTVAGRLDAYRFEAEDRLLEDGDDSGARTLSQLSPMAGFAWTPAGRATLYANVSTSFETPTTSELSNRPDGAGGLNPALEPQTTVSAEVGGRASFPGAAVDLEAAVYRADVTDALVPFEGPDGQAFFRNAGSVDRLGAELRVGWRPLADVEAGLAYAYQDFAFDRFVTPEGDFSGRREPAVPEHRVRASLGAGLPLGLHGRVRFAWQDDMPVNDANTAFDGSHRVVDLRLSWRGGAGRWRARPFLGLDNVFDERYNASVVPNAFGGRFYEPAPGRQLFAGVEVGWPEP